jgi:hypothetical protein
MLAVLYSYNKSRVHAKHIMIKIKLMLWKENIQDQYISLEQTRICRFANQRLAAQCVQRTTVNMSFYGEVDDSWILRVQNKYKFLFQDRNVYGSR